MKKIDGYGRRSTLLVGLFTMSFSLVIACILSHTLLSLCRSSVSHHIVSSSFIQPSVVESSFISYFLRYLIASLLLVYVFAYSSTFQILVFLLPSEIFLANFRSKGVSLGVGSFVGSTVLYGSVTKYLINHFRPFSSVGDGGSAHIDVKYTAVGLMMLSAAISFILFFYYFFAFPETNGIYICVHMYVACHVADVLLDECMRLVALWVFPQFNIHTQSYQNLFCIVPNHKLLCCI